jgi:hypothetical protein
MLRVRGWEGGENKKGEAKPQARIPSPSHSSNDVCNIVLLNF